MRLNIFGLGKIGTVMSVLYSSKGHEVIGFDPAPGYFKGVMESSFDSGEPGLGDLIKALNRLPIHSQDLKDMAKSSVSLVIVPTPSLADGSYDCRFVEEVVRQVTYNVEDPQSHLVVIKSTVLPGDLAKIRRNVEEEFGACPELVYNPEFIALGEVVENMRRPDLVLIGSRTSTHAATVEALVRTVVESQPAIERLSIEEAELAKVALNSFITMKITFANVIGSAASRLGSREPSKVLAAIGQDRRVGSRYLSPGIGFGGPCFPRDNRALENALGSLSLPGVLQNSIDSLNELVGESFSKSLEAIFEKQLSSKPSLNFLVIGLSYKVGSPELVESQAIKLAKKASEMEGVTTYYFDPFVRTDEVSTAMPKAIPISSESQLFGQKFDVIFLALPILEPERLALCLGEKGTLVNPWA